MTFLVCSFFSLKERFQPEEITFTSENWLKINHVSGPKPALITLENWQLSEEKIQPQKLCVLYFYQVDVSQITEEVLLLVPQCNNLTIIAFYSVVANTENNARLMEDLNKRLNSLPHLTRIDIRDTHIFSGEFLENLRCPKLKHLTLANMKLECLLNELLHCIKAHPKLSYLNVEDCCLKPDEINSVLSVVTSSLKKLVGLRLDCNNLSSCVESLCKLVESISTIKILSLSSCKLGPIDLLLILSKVQQNIEYISVYDNAFIHRDIEEAVLKLPNLKGFPVKENQTEFTFSNKKGNKKGVMILPQRPDIWEFEMLGFNQSFG